MRVSVTQEHIDRGNDCENCPIALAEVYPTAIISVDDLELYIDGRAYNTPIAVGLFIRRFDRGVEVQPLSLMWSNGKARSQSGFRCTG